MSNSAFNPERSIDLAKFPVHELENAEGQRFLERCRAELDESGACNLDRFLRPDAAVTMAQEAIGLQALAYEKRTVRNAYFTKDDPALPADHPLRQFFPLRMSQLANDAIPKSAAIQQLYEW